MSSTVNKVDLKNLTQAGLVAYVESLGQPAFRGKQIMGWLYRPGVTDFAQMTDLAKEFRSILAEHAFISRFTDPLIEKSADGCVKFGFRLGDGNIIESVLIPEPDRNTLCISSQVGCAMGCAFCLTGTMGFKRNLTPAEIVNQICGVRDYLLAQPREQLIGPDRVTNVVFMGMGEPLNNLENVLDSLSIVTEQKGLDLTPRRITVSTCGIVPKMRELGEKSPVNLAISLHAVDDETRRRLMPINDRYSIDELLDACRDFPMPKRKRIMFEYILLKGINDSDRDARELARKLSGIPCKINLLPYNESAGLPYQSPGMDRLLAFQQILLEAHYTVFIRNSRGADISAACGQLATEKSVPQDSDSE
ncbi:MAG: 23S rRNA (adenine(2503)-C(2))-methyltransferase [Desulfobacterales bacterium GWB2_56_26]|nr:MAG: 23S rRNA (adenine(2503)-C(2))-methyltransferase [Desulfobacterales bacterium GWB2_56_26]